MRVLLADDSSLILERLQEMLSKFKAVEIVGLCKNGTETLETLRIMKPDLAVVDIHMPGLNGLGVLSEIRKENKTIQFIILTLFSSDDYRQKAIQAGADFFFDKADDFEKVSQVVSSMVEKDTMKLIT